MIQIISSLQNTSRPIYIIWSLLRRYQDDICRFPSYKVYVLRLSTSCRTSDTATKCSAGTFLKWYIVNKNRLTYQWRTTRLDKFTQWSWDLSVMRWRYIHGPVFGLYSNTMLWCRLTPYRYRRYLYGARLRYHTGEFIKGQALIIVSKPTPTFCNWNDLSPPIHPPGVLNFAGFSCPFPPSSRTRTFIIHYVHILLFLFLL